MNLREDATLYRSGRARCAASAHGHRRVARVSVGCEQGRDQDVSDASPPSEVTGHSGDDRPKWHRTWSVLVGREQEAWTAARQGSLGQGSAPRILMATGTGGYPLGSLVESALAVALTERGAVVETLLCDGVLPACQQSDFGDLHGGAQAAVGTQPRCEKCASTGRACVEPLGIKMVTYGQLLPEKVQLWAEQLSAGLSLSDIPGFELEGLRLGEHAYAGTLRYFARGDLVGEPSAEAVLRRYFKAALLTARAVQRLFDKRHYDVVCFHHGIYVPQGVVGEVCRSRGVRVVNWNPAYRANSFVFSHGDSYHHTMITEPVSTWETLELTPAVRTRIETYLQSRRTGREDWIWFHPEPVELGKGLLAAIGADPSRPVFALLTSVIWDARLHYSSNAFASMVEWIVDTVEYFLLHPDRQLVIRIHPAELTGSIPSRQTVRAELSARFPVLPANVFVIGPESPLSTYDLIELSQAALIYNTKTGIEIATRGVPVVVAGEAWIRNKGFSMDASSPREYRELLDRAATVPRLTPELRDRALRYAYHFFFRRMIPLPFVTRDARGQFRLSVSGVDQLLPGRHVGLDRICDGILSGASFVFNP